MSESETVIELNGLTKKFGAFAAVSDAMLSIKSGEVVGFVGANGAGKTTTISMLLGFISPSAGTVKLFGRTVTPQQAHRFHGRIGYVAGDMELPSNLTGRQYMKFLLRQSPVKGTGRFDEMTERFKPQLDKKIKTLSRGNKQKLALVAALSTDPDLLILDEPTSGLDPGMQEVFLEVVRDYKAKGKTVFMSSHYLQEVMEACSRVVLMQNGEIIQDMPVDELTAMGGKHVSIKSGYRPTKPPKHAESVSTSFEDDLLTLSFVYKADLDELQRWVAGVKLLKDIEISEYNLEETFSTLYETEKSS